MYTHTLVIGLAFTSTLASGVPQWASLDSLPIPKALLPSLQQDMLLVQNASSPLAILEDALNQANLGASRQKPKLSARATADSEVPALKENIESKTARPWRDRPWEDQGHNTHYMNVRLFQELTNAADPATNPVPIGNHVDNAPATAARPGLPADVVLEILDAPAHWILTQRYRLEVTNPQNDEIWEPALQVSSRSGNVEELVVMETEPFGKVEAQGIREVKVTFESKDQGFSDFPDQHGSFDRSGSWLQLRVVPAAGNPNPSQEGGSSQEAESSQEDESSQEGDSFVRHLTHNIHAGSDLVAYSFTFTPRHLLSSGRGILSGDRIQLVALAQWPGWKTAVTSGSMEILSRDMLVGYDLNKLMLEKGVKGFGSLRDPTSTADIVRERDANAAVLMEALNMQLINQVLRKGLILDI